MPLLAAAQELEGVSTDLPKVPFLAICAAALITMYAFSFKY